MKAKLKDNKGETMISTLLILILAMTFIAYVFDFGYAFITKVQMQNANDAAALGGAVISSEGYSGVGGSNINHPEGVIRQVKAESVASKIMDINRKNYLLKDKVTVMDVEFNKYIGGRKDGTAIGSLEKEKLYYDGIFNVDTVAKYELEWFTLINRSVVFTNNPKAIPTGVNVYLHSTATAKGQ